MWWGGDTAHAVFAAARAGSRLDRMTAASKVARPKIGEPLGRIAIPRLGLETVIVEGDGDLELSYAAGHVPGTALPGASGNVAMAGHRDSVFARLARVRRGDAIVVTTPDARYRYVVSSAQVVGPDATWVLDSTAGASLTLVTCYPFRYVGPAPRRFVVRATLTGSAPALPSLDAARPARRVG